MDTKDIQIGATYRTLVAEWTVEDIMPSGNVLGVREDGRRAWFPLDHFANYMAQERIVGRPLPDRWPLA